MKIRCFLILWVVLIRAGGPSPTVTQAENTLTIFAAASLADVFEATAEDFSATYPDTEIVFNFAASSDLAAQLSEGAPADLFASANLRQMQIAQASGRISGEPRFFAKNRLVLIVPADNPAQIQGLRDLAKPGVLLVVAAEGVPIRDYTNTMLDKLAAVYGEDFRAAVLANVVSEEQNVRAVVAKVALGEADAGIVYTSDVTPDIRKGVIVLPIPDAYNTLAAYPMALTNDAPNPALAQAFMDYLLSDAGQDLLVAWNFLSVRIPELPPTIPLIDDGRLRVEGQVYAPLILSMDDLQRDYPQHTLDQTAADGQTITYTGVRLWEVIGSAQVNIDLNQTGDALSLLIVASSATAQLVIAWGEIDPAYGNLPVLIAFAANGQPRPFTLIAPDGRCLENLLNLNVRDAPPITIP